MGISVKDKVALVTGANRGIGKAIVEAFLREGARKVYLVVRNPETAVVLEKRYGEAVETLVADLADRVSIGRLAEQASDAEIVVNNAGILIPSSPIAEGVEDALSKELEVNVFGLLRVANTFAPILEANGGGALVQMNSIASIKNFADLSTYSASKAAAYSLTQGLREKLATKGIAVLSVHPGPIQTDMGSEAGFDGSPEPSVVADGIVEALASGTFHLFPDEMAKQFDKAYQSFADNIVLADFSESA
ncbi:SDR family oxidoreductase [Pelagicoccus albus]|uniref:SDR family oxidoreductase n=1 Tax=Pelagicoccus albus TaxID=415222 RepID=A0A7X1E7D9_9BACT|nr:SDR family oxidoreductase [Pelagicoccus albus]MBC2605028.1 SDR family oxidoreductase [Pelagicoccus albus]